MKNIHLLPTDKPNRLVKLKMFGKDKLHLCKVVLPIENEEQYQHIYITSDEEIKEREWCTDGIYLIQATPKLVDAQGLFDRRDWRKIILTTDQELIKDGVQAIDDKFLEWFVKNQSCESVETKLVEFEVDMGLGDECIEHGNYYKIIIPQEEPKCTCEEHDPYCCQIHGICPTCVKKEDNPFKLPKALPDDVFYQSIEQKQKTLKEEETKQDKYTLQDFINGIFWNKSKQETLEQAAERLYPGVDRQVDRMLFINGANWQAERMYSEEDLLSAFEAGMMFIGEDKGSFREWFEQFKKTNNGK